MLCYAMPSKETQRAKQSMCEEQSKSKAEAKQSTTKQKQKQRHIKAKAKAKQSNAMGKNSLKAMMQWNKI